MLCWVDLRCQSRRGKDAVESTPDLINISRFACEHGADSLDMG